MFHSHAAALADVSLDKARELGIERLLHCQTLEAVKRCKPGATGQIFEEDPMKMQRVTSPHVKEAAPQTWSNCRVHGNQVFIAGMTAGDGAGGVLGDGSMYSQAKETFTKIKHLIEAAGGMMNDIIRVDIYVTDIKQREDVWRARKEFFTGDFPTSTLVEVRALAMPRLLVEVNAVGFLGASA
jgi:2-iminobutanoate/2-iminopropanoate deaminase